jgi:hypothetical protein
LIEIYAGFLAQTDKEIDRLADTIKDIGQWDNTFQTGKRHDRSHLEDIDRSANLELLPPGAAVLAKDRDNDSKPRTLRMGKRPWHFRSGL